MKTGRNDPCPCGSGKKYKKCCLGKDREAGEKRPPNLGALRSASNPPAAVTPPAIPAPPPRPKDPAVERAEARWKEFKSKDYEGRIAVFLNTLDDQELMTESMAFEMLTSLHEEAVKRNDRPRFAELVGALRERRPDVFDENGHYFLSWCLQDALAEGRQEAVRPLALELAPRSGAYLDTVNRTLDVLAYHGQLAVLIEVMHLGWPGVKASTDTFEWAITEFGGAGADYEIYDYLEQTASPDPNDPALLERVKFFIEDPRPEYLPQVIGDWMGTNVPAWKVDDFTLKPPRKKRRYDWDEEPEEEPQPDQGELNLGRLISEFVVYLRRVEGVPFPKGELVRDELFRYFLKRHRNDLDPRPSMLEQALHPNKKLPKPPPPAHPLCPERVTFDVYLAGLVSLMNGLFHKAAALFEVVPAWLRFLESRGLIDAELRAKVVEEFRPLHAQVLRMWESFRDDPSLYRAAQRWPEDAAKGAAEPRSIR